MERNYSDGPPGEKQPMSAVDFAEMMDVEYSVDEYFEPEELAKMSPIEKRRYKNLRANYEVMKAMGKVNKTTISHMFQLLFYYCARMGLG